MDTQPERLTYTIEEAAKMLGVGRSAAYEAARRGEIPIIKIGARLLVPRRRFDDIVAGREIAA